MSRRAIALVVALGLVLSLGIAVFAAPWASSSPDGLERVAADEGFEDSATAHATAGHRDGENMPPVIASSAAVELRRPTELGHADDERLVEQAALLQIIEQCGKPGVHWWDEDVLQSGGLVGMGVPAGVGRGFLRPAVPVHLDQPHIGFNQATCQQAALSELRIPVALSGLR